MEAQDDLFCQSFLHHFMRHYPEFLQPKARESEIIMKSYALKIYDILNHSLFRICERTACPISGQAVFFFISLDMETPQWIQSYM